MSIKNKVPIKKTVLKPDKTTRLVNELKSTPWNEIRELYNDPNTLYNFMGCLFNSIYTCQVPMFIMSYRVFLDLVKEDQNLSRRSIRTIEYKLLMQSLVDNKILTCSVPHSKIGAKTRRAGLYKIKDEDIRKWFPNILDLESKALNSYGKG